MSSGTYVWQAPNLISHHRASWDACLHLSLPLADGDMHPCPGEAARDPAGSLTIRWHQRAVAGPSRRAQVLVCLQSCTCCTNTGSTFQKGLGTRRVWAKAAPSPQMTRIRHSSRKHCSGINTLNHTKPLRGCPTLRNLCDVTFRQQRQSETSMK